MADLMVVTPDDGVTAASSNCPVLTKQRAFIVDRGVAATLQWEMRDSAGNPINLAEYLCTDAQYLPEQDSSDSDDSECGTVVVRFADAVSPGGCEPIEVTGRTYDDDLGIVRFDLPEAVYNYAGLWEFNVGVKATNGSLVLVNKGVVSIERGLFGSTERYKFRGPPTLQEIRMQLRDTMQENDLNQLPEFSDQELVFAIGKPLRLWNETPPPIQPPATASNFPYRENWLKAICAELFSIAATWYMRNKFNAAGAGIQDESRDKAKDYVQAALMLQQQWADWMAKEKNRISSAQFFGSFGSNYPG